MANYKYWWKYVYTTWQSSNTVRAVASNWWKYAYTIWQSSNTVRAVVSNWWKYVYTTWQSSNTVRAVASNWWTHAYITWQSFCLFVLLLYALSQQLWSWQDDQFTYHTFFLGKLEQAVNQYYVHILSLVTDNNPSWMIQQKGGEWP